LAPDRRAFLLGGAASFASLVVPSRVLPDPKRLAVLKPPRLRPGDTAAVINPVSLPLSAEDVRVVCSALEALDLRVRCAARLGSAASDEERARELLGVFADPSVKALVPVRGGWGSARLLPHLDYGLIRRNPKVVIGFSDVSALLLGIQARTGLVTFHGPMGISPFVPFTVAQLRRVLFDGAAARLGDSSEGEAAGPGPRPEPIVPGRARGRLLGGNLTVVSSMVGSPYLDRGRDLILFLEEVREPISEVSRRLTQLELSGVLRRAHGLVFGDCTRCAPPMADESLTLQRVLDEQIAPLGVPAWWGAPIGHTDRQLTLPIGVHAEIDASARTIQLLEPAVS
jgi:muramoyltetrapeptide carboxypeptidase